MARPSKNQNETSSVEEVSSIKKSAKYVVTTSGSNSAYYCIYSKAINGEQSILKSVHIAGGANVANVKSGEAVASKETIVSEEDLELLRANPAFARKEKRGFIIVTKRGEDVANDLNKKDKSAQKEESDFKEAGGATPTKEVK